MSTITTSSLIQYRRSVHPKLEEDLIVRIDFDSHDALRVETVDGNGKQFHQLMGYSGR
jgi:hypothetical protein